MIVAIVAIGRQRVIAQEIIDKSRLQPGAERQSGNLAGGCCALVEEQRSRGFAGARLSARQTVDGDHGRIETPRVAVIRAFPSSVGAKLLAGAFRLRPTLAHFVPRGRVKAAQIKQSEQRDHADRDKRVMKIRDRDNVPGARIK